MARSARQPEIPLARRGFIVRGALAALAAVASNPLVAGGVTAFLVAFAFVSANALWYQPFHHDNAFIATRAAHGAAFPAAKKRTDAQTTIRIEREAEIAPPPPADPSIREAQQALALLGLYDGAIDGLTGPKTRAAIAAYQRQSGLEPSGDIDDVMLAQLAKRSSDGMETASLAAATPPLPRPDQAGAATNGPDPVIVQIQAGLRAFGNDGIDLDGIAGARTRAAIREFQSLFGLTVDGEPDDALLAKMKDVGLVN